VPRRDVLTDVSSGHCAPEGSTQPSCTIISATGSNHAEDSSSGCVTQSTSGVESDAETEEEEVLYVTCTNNSKRRRDRDKKFACIYRSARVAQLPRHMYSLHAKEVEVSQLRPLQIRIRRKLCSLNLKIWATTKTTSMQLLEDRGLFVSHTDHLMI
jgi:hypothetical protein